MLWKLTIPGFRSDHMTISEDGRRLYVSALTEKVVVEVDTRARAIVRQFDAGQWPHDNHLSEDGDRLYNGSIGNIIAPKEAREASPPEPYQLTVVRTADLRPLRTFRFDRGVRPIVITHDERRMYAQLSELHGLIEFDLVAGRTVKTRRLPIDKGVTEDDYDFEAPHHGLAVTPDEKTLCAAGRASDYVALVATDGLRPLAIIDVDDAPGWAATSPDGRHCFVANTRADTLSVISYAKRRQVARIRGGDGPKQIEAALIPERVLCARPAVPGCSRAIKLSRRCTARGRLRLRLVGDIDAVARVYFRFGRSLVSRETAPPFKHRVPRRLLARTRAKRVRAAAVIEGKALRLSRPLPRCGLRRG